MKVERRTITGYRILVWLCMVPYLEPSCVSGSLDIIYNIGKVTSFIICICMIFFSHEKRKVCAFEKYIICFYGIYLLSTIINNGNILRAFIESITVVGFCLVICIFGFAKKRKQRWIYYQVVTDIYTVFLIINTLSIIKFPGGINALDSYFLGHDDALLYWIIPYNVFSFLYYKLSIKKRKVTAIHISIFITIISLLVSKSTSGILSMILFMIVYFVVPKSIRVLGAINLTVLLMNLGFVVLKVHHGFSFIIEEILHKTVGLTGRDKIWDRVLYWVKQKPILGYGYEESAVLIPKFTLTDGSYFRFANCHNFLLQVMYNEGVIGILIFLILYYVTYRRMLKGGINEYNRIIVSSIISIMSALLVNSYLQPIALFTLLTMGYETVRILKYRNQQYE